MGRWWRDEEDWWRIVAGKSVKTAQPSAGTKPAAQSMVTQGPMAEFDLFIGIDYSGAGTRNSRLPGLQLYAAEPGGTGAQRLTPSAKNNRGTNSRIHWTRQEVAERLHAEVSSGKRVLIGIDHCFSFPQSYFSRYGLKSWPEFLADITAHWGTHEIRESMRSLRNSPEALQRVGYGDEFRLTERWTSSAKCVFVFDVHGSVAMSSYAGIPWLKWLRDELPDRLHFWPYDAWEPMPGKSVIAEVYPSIFRRRYPRERRRVDEQDAYATARWMADMYARGGLDGYFDPPLTPDERELAALEGWILGVR
jgi:hypothetical protein